MHIMIVLNGLNDVVVISGMFLCIINFAQLIYAKKRAKMSFFDHLIEFDGVDWSDTASSDG